MILFEHWGRSNFALGCQNRSEVVSYPRNMIKMLVRCDYRVAKGVENWQKRHEPKKYVCVWVYVCECAVRYRNKKTLLFKYHKTLRSGDTFLALFTLGSRGILNKL